MRCAALFLGVLLAGISTVGAERPRKQVPVKRDALFFLTDGHGHFFAASPRNVSPELFYANGKGPFYRQRVISTSSGPGRRSFGFWSPQAMIGYKHNRNVNAIGGSLVLKAGKWSVSCAARKTPLVKVDASTSARLRKSKFLPQLHDREVHLVARDDTGVYYLVDKRARDGGVDYRLFVGKPGAMRKIRLSTVIVDDVGEVFAGAGGRFVRNHRKDSLQWTPRNGRSAEVFQLKSGRTRYLVFGELGVYKGRLGTPCDDL